MSNHAASTRPPKCLSLESKAHRKARLFHTSGTWVPRGTPPPRDERSLTVRGPFLFRATSGARLRSRLEQIFCVLLRLSERSRTIEVRVTTLSAQNLHKIFRSMLRDYVYLIGSMPTFNNLVAVICSVLHQLFARSFDERVTESHDGSCSFIRIE